MKYTVQYDHISKLNPKTMEKLSYAFIMIIISSLSSYSFQATRAT